LTVKKYKSVIIGCGARAAAHIEAYRQIKNADLVACCDHHREKREQRAAEFKIRAYDNPREMIAKEKPDMVHLATGPYSRVELMTLVSEAKVPLCTTEKPLATGVKDWRKLCELEAKSKTKFAVCHQFRWQKHLAACAKAIRSGKLGKVLFIDMSARMNISGQGTHTLNYGMLLNGDSPVALVFANASGWDSQDKIHPAPLTTEAYLTFENGVRGLWTSGCVSPQVGDPKTVWRHFRVAAYAEKGRVGYEGVGKWEIAGDHCQKSGTFGGMEELQKNNIAAQAAFHCAMFAWLEDKRKIPGTNLRQSIHEWAVVLALYQSSIEGRPVSMKGFNPPDNLVELYRQTPSALRQC
jgi:predicted dehydrogenase